MIGELIEYDESQHFESLCVPGLIELTSREGASEWNDEEKTMWKRLLGDASSHVLVVLLGDETAGFASWRADLSTPFCPAGSDSDGWWNEYCWIQVVYIVPRARHRALATRLYTAIERQARVNGLTEIMLDVYCCNEPSLQFHRRLGFAPMATICRLQRAHDHGHEKNGSRRSQVPGVEFRQLEESDEQFIVDSLVSIYEEEVEDSSKFPELFDKVWRRDEWLTFTSNNQAIVAIDVTTKKQLGFIGFRRCDRCPYGGSSYGKYHYTYEFINDLFVSAKMRGRGLATHMLSQVIKHHCQNRYVLSSYVDTNAASIAVHSKLGFTPYVRVLRKCIAAESKHVHS